MFDRKKLLAGCTPVVCVGRIIDVFGMFANVVYGRRHLFLLRVCAREMPGLLLSLWRHAGRTLSRPRAASKSQEDSDCPGKSVGHCIES